MTSTPADQSPVTWAERSLLWLEDRQRYRHVYKKGRRWKAEVRIGRRLRFAGVADAAQEAAELVVRFFRRNYGAGWAEKHKRAVSAANAAPRRRRERLIQFRPKTGLYVVIVWVYGVRTVLTPPRKKGFPDRESARAFFERWKYVTFGLFAGDALFRPPAGAKSPANAGH